MFATVGTRSSLQWWGTNKHFATVQENSRTMVFTDPRLKHLPLLYPPFFDFSVGAHAHNGLDVHGVHDMGRSSVRAHFVFQDICPKTQLYFGLTCGRATSKKMSTLECEEKHLSLKQLTRVVFHIGQQLFQRTAGRRSGAAVASAVCGTCIGKYQQVIHGFVVEREIVNVSTINQHNVQKTIHNKQLQQL